MRITCRDVEEQLTPFVDGELPESASAPVADHLAVCPLCRQRAAHEAVGRQLMQERGPRMMPPAPAALHASIRHTFHGGPTARRGFSFGWLAASAVATVVVAVGLVAVAGVVRPIPVFAAQATLDHLKCMRLGPSATSSDAKLLETSWRTAQGWDLHVPTGRAAGMRLLGYRRCVITEGRVAHLLYERNGAVVSLFVLPDGPKVGHEELEMFGQDAVLWTSHGFTYALVGRGDRATMAAAASSLERELGIETAAAGQGL